MLWLYRKGLNAYLATFLQHAFLFIKIYQRAAQIFRIITVISTALSICFCIHFPHTTIFCSRQLWKYLGKNMNNVFSWMYNYWIELKSLWAISPFNPLPHIDAFWRLCNRLLFENIVTKEEIAQNVQFLLLTQCFPFLVIGYLFN